MQAWLRWRFVPSTFEVGPGETDDGWTDNERSIDWWMALWLVPRTPLAVHEQRVLDQARDNCMGAAAHLQGAA